MKRFLLLFFAVALYMSAAVAQDVIVQKDGSELQSQVTEVGETAIKYRKYDNLEGPVYTVNKSEVFMIKYQNGSKDVFQTTVSSSRNAAIPELSPSFLPAISYASGSVYANGIPLSKEKVRTLYAATPQALSMYKKGKNLQTAGAVLLGIGAGCVGASLGFGIGYYSSSYSYDNYYLVVATAATAAVGVTTLIPGLILNAVGNRKIRQSVNLYNSSSNASAFDNVQLNYGIMPSGGLGMSVVF